MAWPLEYSERANYEIRMTKMGRIPAAFSHGPSALQSTDKLWLFLLKSLQIRLICFFSHD